MIQIEASESVTWTAGGLVLEARAPFPDRFWVIVRHVGSAPVLWDGDLMGQSAKALDRYWGQLSAMYGQGSIAGMWMAMLDGEQQLVHLGSARQTNLQAVVQGVLDAASFVRP